jgi:sulfatase maturation enzyme AslB (radical SAM superfamily)
MKDKTLKYLEIHLVDHCNLNCKGCGHFSPLSKPHFVEVEAFKKDLLKFKQHISHITQLRLMGGEPFLHPEFIDFVKIARDIYSQSRIAVVTNGILLPEQKRKTLKTLKKLNIEVHITAYPILEQQTDNYIKILDSYRIKYEIEHTKTFFKHINLNKEQDPYISISNCRKHNYCPALKDGMLYQCSGLANMPIFINYFNVQTQSLPTGLDIYNKLIDAEKILDFLDLPDALCAHCFYGKESFDWNHSNKELNEWIL